MKDANRSEDRKLGIYFLRMAKSWVLKSSSSFFHSSIVIAIFCQEKTIKNHNFEKQRTAFYVRWMCTAHMLIHCCNHKKKKNWKSKPNLKAIIEENNSKTAFQRIISWKKRKITSLGKSECGVHFKDVILTKIPFFGFFGRNLNIFSHLLVTFNFYRGWLIRSSLIV